MFNDPQFWIFVAFVIFIAAIFNPVRKILSSSLDNKIQEIIQSIDQAEKLKKDAQITLGEIKRRQNDIKNEIDLMHQDTKNKIDIIESNAHSKLNEKIDKRNSLALVKIDQITREANDEIREHITQTAIRAVINILEKKLIEKEKQNLIDLSIKEFSSVIKN